MRSDQSQEKQHSERTRFKRMAERGTYDRGIVDQILDAMPLCHVGYNFNGHPFVTPTLQWREGDHVYWHGSAAGRMIETSAETDVCLTVTLIDGIVLSRSAIKHSARFRSVMLFGRPTLIADPELKEKKLRSFINTLFPGRWELLRPVAEKEIKATKVLSLPIDEYSAKVRTGWPKDLEEDYDRDIWAGVLPIRMQVDPPLDDPRLKPGLTPPDHVLRFGIGQGALDSP